MKSTRAAVQRTGTALYTKAYRAGQRVSTPGQSLPLSAPTVGQRCRLPPARLAPHRFLVLWRSRCSARWFVLDSEGLRGGEMQFHALSFLAARGRLGNRPVEIRSRSAAPPQGIRCPSCSSTMSTEIQRRATEGRVHGHGSFVPRNRLSLGRVAPPHGGVGTQINSQRDLVSRFYRCFAA